MASTVALSTRAVVTKKEILEAIFVENLEADRTDDELNTLYNMVNWVSDSLESFVGQPIIQRAYVEHSDGGGEYIFLTTLPVVAVTKVTENGVVLTSGTDYVYDADLAAIRRLSDTDATVASTFSSGVMSVKVEYTAGYGVQVPSAEPEFILNPAYPAVPPAPAVPEYIDNPAYDPSGIIGVVGVPDDFKLATYVWVQSLWVRGPENFSPQQGQVSGSGAAIPYQVKELMRNRKLQVHWIGM